MKLQDKFGVCPIATAITLVGTKWKIQILRDLVTSEHEALRFSQFKSSIAEISDKMLSQSLKELEQDHLIRRCVLDTKPPRTEYRLTDMGKSLGDVLRALYAWGLSYQTAYFKNEKGGNEQG